MNENIKVEIWAEDEARIGLHPIVRRVWNTKGERPLAQHKTRYEWDYVYGFVHPNTGESEFLIFPTVSNDITSIALEEFSKLRKLKETNTYVILIIDQAGFHSLKSLVIPENILLFSLPPYSPELQPTECIWPLLKEAVANKNFPSLEALEETIINRCNILSSDFKTVKGAVGFKWICQIVKQYELS